MRLPAVGKLTLVVALSVGGGVSQPLSGIVDSTSLPVRFWQDRTLAGLWRVTGAEMRESGTATWGVLKVQNFSGKRIQNARFYVEYFDNGGRFCFSLVFASEKHIGRKGEDVQPVAPREQRELLSVAVALGPATEPTDARVHLLSQQYATEAEQTISGDSLVRSPVTVSGDGLETSIWLNLRPEQREIGILDLVFAKVLIDADGKLSKIEILGSVDGGTSAWFERIARQPDRFRAATLGFKGVPAAGLVLVRTINPRKIGSSLSPQFLARQSDWVKTHAVELQGQELPPVNQLFYVKSAGLDIPPPPGDLPVGREVFQLNSAGSFWSGTLTRWDWERTTGRWVLHWVPTDMSRSK
jgi:hypothetical protein